MTTRWEMAPEITVCTPVYNGLLTLPRMLEALTSCQSIPLRLIVADDGSTDGSRALLESPTWRAHLRVRSWASVDVLPPSEAPLDKERIWDHKLYLDRVTAIRGRLLAAVQTEWTWWVDQDVMVPPGGARTIWDSAKMQGDLCGVIGLLAEPVADHVRWDCAIAPTTVLRELVADGWGRDGCECRWAHKKLVAAGLRCGYVDGWQARHLRLEMAGLGAQPPPQEVDHHDLHVKIVGREQARVMIEALEVMKVGAPAANGSATPPAGIPAIAVGAAGELDLPQGEPAHSNAVDGEQSADAASCRCRIVQLSQGKRDSTGDLCRP